MLYSFINLSSKGREGEVRVECSHLLLTIFSSRDMVNSSTVSYVLIRLSYFLVLYYHEYFHSFKLVTL